MEKNAMLSPSSYHWAARIWSPKQAQQKQNPGRQGGKSLSPKHQLIGHNQQRKSNAIRKTQEGPHYGVSHENGGHLHVHQTQQPRQKKSNTADLSPWDNPFFRNQGAPKRLTKRSPPVAEQDKWNKVDTDMEWFLRNLAKSPFPIQTVHTLGKALEILTGRAKRSSKL